MTGLPAPAASRFVPLRLGLVDLYQYDVQEFRFKDGRLLIRGDNGSGKSKVLALTLPLLLDANLAPHRVEPDADRGKHMHWNLLQGGEYEERTGYSWVEFGRLDESGEPRFVTLGLGMKAAAGRGIVRQWWFTTAQRVGEGLHLVDQVGTALTRERLTAAVGDAGVVRDTAEAYRRDVDGLLFGLGEQRYSSIVDLLVHLRQPQLSKRPDEATLGRALTDSLPPLGQDVIEDVAQAFQTLEEDRTALEELRASSRAARAFIGEYARYARVASARAAEGPRRAQSLVDAAQRQLREARAVQQEAADRLVAARAATAAAEDEVERARAEIDALRDLRASDAYTGLQAARQEAERAAGAAERTTAEAKDAARRAEAADRDTGAAEEDASASAARLEASAAEAAEAAGRAGLAARHGAAALAAEAERRRGQLVTVRSALASQTAALAALARARQLGDDAEARLAAARSEEDAAADAASRAAGEWVEATRAALVAAVELRPADDLLLDLVERAAGWADQPDGVDPIAAWADGTLQVRAAEIATEVARLRTERAAAEERLASLDAERDRLAAGGVTPPPAPTTRAAARGAGLPFWRAVEVAPELDPASSAGLEAALEAAGLLDAWLDADATLTGRDGDVLLVPAPLDGPTLADVLRPARIPDGVLDAGRVDALLRSVRLGASDAEVWVAVDGRFRAGAARGGWTKPEAVYLGEAARERARTLRLAGIAAERAGVVAGLEDLAVALDAAADRSVALREERRGLPLAHSVRRAADTASASSARTRRAEREADAAIEAVGGAERVSTDAGQELAWTAAEFRLPVDAAGLEQVAAALDDLRGAVRVLGDRERAAADAEARAGAARQRAADAGAVLARRRDEATEAMRQRTVATQRYDTVRRSMGDDVLQLDSRLALAEQSLDGARRRAKTGLGAAEEAFRAAGDADARTEDAADREREAVAARAEATEAFRGFASTGVLRLLPVDLDVPDLAEPWAPDPTVRLARRIPADPADLEDQAWDTAQNRLQTAFDTVQTALGVRGRSAEQDVRHGIAVVTIRTGARRLEPDVLAVELEQDVGDRERLLTEQEREILENHLLDEVASSLQSLMHAADVQVAAMNRELEARPTSSGLRIRITWKPVEDSGLDQARRRLLLRTAAAWSPADRAAIGGFLQDRIESERAADPEGVWHERLTSALDYRRWNRFVVELHQDGTWRPASGPASGGERVLAASVPLFAAASAHYGSAAPHAPRLILLDEAFAGVDDRARASYLGLLATFDLDVVMTSEREWAAYPEVPGIAIANLTRLEGLRAVHVDHWEWDGTARRRVADPGPTAAAERPHEHADDLMLTLE